MCRLFGWDTFEFGVTQTIHAPGHPVSAVKARWRAESPAVVEVLGKTTWVTYQISGLFFRAL
jgi:hypothetical protein